MDKHEFEASLETTDAEYIKGLLQQFREAYDNGIGRLGVPFPSSSRIGPMLALFQKIGQPVSQEEITIFCRKYGFPEYHKQLRHIATAGYYILTGNQRSTNMEKIRGVGSNYLALKTLKERNPLASANRSAQISGASWEELLAMYEHRGCAMCGQHHDQYDKGHLDRTKPAITGNVVPLCSPCNNWLQAKDLDATVNDQGVCRPVVEKRR